MYQNRSSVLRPEMRFQSITDFYSVGSIPLRAN